MTRRSGEGRIDFGQMRLQVLAAGDAVLALDGLPRAQIAGDYPALQEQLDQGTKTACPFPTPAARARSGSVNARH